LNTKLINLNLISKTKKGVMEELVDLISTSGLIKNKKALLKALLEREALGTTGIGNGVAIPHAREVGVKRLVVAFGRSKEGVDFGALDGEKTYLFFILATPRGEIGTHLKILAKIAHLLKDKYIRNCLIKADAKKEVIEIIKNVEVQR
jgi:fructose-specific phosphotransferase system IIA component